MVIAEDNPIMRRMIESVVKRIGWTFDSSEDGIGALTAVERRSRELALVLSDIEMPRMNGLELVTEIKKRPDLSNFPVILMSSADRKLDAMVAGCDRFLIKPFTVDQLVDALTMGDWTMVHARAPLDQNR